MTEAATLSAPARVRKAREQVWQLTEDEEERVGLTLMLLHDRMGRLRDRFGIAEEDLDLGPLGPLLPR